MRGDRLLYAFLMAWRSACDTDKARMRKLLAGVLSGRVTLTPQEAKSLRPGEAMALADALPDEPLADWIGRGRTN